MQLKLDKMAHILIIDDDDLTCDLIGDRAADMGHRFAYAHTCEDGLSQATSSRFDIIFLDVRLPDGKGLDLLPAIRETPSRPEVIIITGQSDPDGAELAIKSGAWDYIEKPLSMGTITLSIDRTLQYRKEKKPGNSPVVLNRESIIGNSPEINASFNLVAQSAASSVNVFITGETGTGKELFARAVHENSSRLKNSFVVVDCAALPEHLVESMLFGHVKGAFTGADRNRDGLILTAHRGTLFLDEVGELPMTLQKSLLRVLQERKFRPIGSSRELESDFRLISATNKNLDEMVLSGSFRQDLLFRLRTFAIELPPLRKRKHDITALTLHYIHKSCRIHGQETKGFVPEFMEILETYDWPGNVRELINLTEKAILAAAGAPKIYPMHLPKDVRIKFTQAHLSKKQRKVFHNNYCPQANLPDLNSSNDLPTLKHFRKKLIAQGESRYLKWLISQSRVDVEKACKISGLGKSRLYSLIKKYGISQNNT